MQRDIKVPEGGDMSDFFGPNQVDYMLRNTIQMCWMGMPKERKTVKDVESLMRKIFERAMKDFHDDAEAFGKRLE